MNQNNNSQPGFGWEKFGVNDEENRRALRRRAVIVYLFVAILAFTCAFGAYLGYFAAQVIAR